jgi:alpha-amylase
MGDDGEKFGAWPTTYEHCWGERRWVERFFTALEDNAAWLATVTPSAWLDGHPPVGRVYVPTSSYTEMTEWALPSDEALTFARVLERDRDDGRPEARWLRGGFWRHFQVKYREINDLHKQMLRASAKVAAMPPGPDGDRATDELGRGQSNDCYWHGLFGGIYLAHMRLATYEHLIAAEDLADASRRGEGDAQTGELVDVDLDGREEVLLSTDGLVVTVKPDEGAGIASWDLRAARHALLAVMRRRPEAYHARMLEAARSAAGRAAERVGEAATAAGARPDGGVTSIHEIAAVKEPDLAERLRYDAYERRSGLVHLLANDVTADAFASGSFDERLDAVDGPFELVELGPSRVVVRRDAAVRSADGTEGTLRIERRLAVGGGRLDPWLEAETIVTNVGDVAIGGRLGVEWNVMLLGGGGNPQAWWEVAGRRTAHDAAATSRDVSSLAQGNDWLGVRVDTTVVPALDAWIAPIETISNSESGFEAVYQGSCLLLSRPVDLRPGDGTGIRVRHSVSVGRDRSADQPSAS